MKVFIVGLPQSGKTTVAQKITSSLGDNWSCINSIDWVKKTFRNREQNEKLDQYEEEYHYYLISRLRNNPNLIIDNIKETLISLNKSSLDSNLVIEGIFSPKDFSYLFDYNNDIVVFLNRTDNGSDIKDYEAIGISVMRDYCFWLSSAELLSKKHWLEYNFKMDDNYSDVVKTLGSKNSVYIVKAIDGVIRHLVSYLQEENGNH